MGAIKYILTLMVLGLACAPSRVLAAGALPVIKEVRVVTSGGNLGVEISADKNLVYNCYKMPQLLKIVVDLPQTEPGRPDTVFKVKSALISTIKMQMKRINEVMVTRVTVNLTEDADFKVQVDPADKKKMTIFLHKPAAVPPVAAKAVAQQMTSVSVPPATKKPPVQETIPTKIPASATELKPAAPAADLPVMVGKINFNPDAIEIHTGGSIKEFRAFTLKEPGRLVIDIPDAHSSLNSMPAPANRFGIVMARIGYFEGKLRLVFEAGEKTFPGYNVEKTDTGLKVMLGKSSR